MRLESLLLASALLSSTAAVTAQTRIPGAAIDRADSLRERALASPLGYDIVESLTTEVGPRLAGSEGDARAVTWAQAKFKALGYDRVWTEPVTFPKWERRSERAEVIGPHSQRLAVIALGGSPAGTVEAEVVRFADLDALKAAPDGSLKGKIAFVDYAMKKTRDGSDYEHGSGIRVGGPSVAIAKGASAFLLRSAGTDFNRSPHTGITRFPEGATPIPAAALAAPDAAQLSRLIATGKTTVRLALDCGWDGTYTSQNVIGEITGAQKPDEVVLIGGHLDSWDPGTGAIDDGAGVAITMAAGALIKPLKPARSIRVVAFANEEQGLYGGKVYKDTYLDAVVNHVMSAESDFGTGRIYGFDSSAAASAYPAVTQIAKALEPLGIAYLPGKGRPESDIGPLTQRGMAWGWLGHDGTDYFDLHHTADDTLDKIDPKALAQNVAAYAVFTYLSAEADSGFGSALKDAPADEER